MFQKLNHIPSSQVVATMDFKIILIGNIVTQVSNVAHLYLSCLANVQLARQTIMAFFLSDQGRSCKRFYSIRNQIHFKDKPLNQASDTRGGAYLPPVNL